MTLPHYVKRTPLGATYRSPLGVHGPGQATYNRSFADVLALSLDGGTWTWDRNTGPLQSLTSTIIITDQGLTRFLNRFYQHGLGSSTITWEGVLASTFSEFRRDDTYLDHPGWEFASTYPQGMRMDFWWGGASGTGPYSGSASSSINTTTVDDLAGFALVATLTNGGKLLLALLEFNTTMLGSGGGELEWQTTATLAKTSGDFTHAGAILALDSFCKGGFPLDFPEQGLIDATGFTGLDPSDTLASHPGWQALGSSISTSLGQSGSGGTKIVSSIVPASFTPGASTVKGSYITLGSGGTLVTEGLFAEGDANLASLDTLLVSYSCTVNDAS